MSNIEEIIKSVNKEISFIGEMSSGDKLRGIETIKFGVPTLDAITGGVPRGLPTEIFGNPSCGKTSLCLHLISESQKQNIRCLYIDAEMAMTNELMKKMNVDTSEIVIARPISGEDTFELIESFAERGYGLIVIDSVSSLAPFAELETDYDKDTIALQARMMSKGMRKIIGIIHRKNVAVVFINQIREKMARMPNAKTTTTSGGRALGFYAGLRLEMARTGWIKKDDDKIGMDVKVHVEKNKLSRPQLETDLEFYFETGFDVGVDLLNHNLRIGKIKLVGRTFYVGNESIGQKEEAIKYLLNA